MTSNLGYPCDEQLVPKSLSIKKATHEEIIKIGNKIFQQSTEQQTDEYKSKILEREEFLKQKLDKAHAKEIGRLKELHRENILKLEQQYIKIQDNALREEAGRVKEIMNHETTKLLKDTVLEGQRKLDEALVCARISFDAEKQKEVDNCMFLQDKKFKNQLNIQKKKHDDVIENLNREWREKLKVELSSQEQILNAMFKEKKETLFQEYQQKLQNELSKMETQHKDVLLQLNEKLIIKVNDNTHFQNDIENLKLKLNEKIKNIQTVLSSFQFFIENSNGFYEGQADFVLKDLIPFLDFEEDM